MVVGDEEDTEEQGSTGKSMSSSYAAPITRIHKDD